jgi:threonine/homoserine/homoserine lactone efflux protein
MPTFEFCLALAALLLTPGPTNTLMALAGAERGWRGALRLAPLEVAAYGLVTIPLALLGERLFAAHGPARFTITLLAAAWVAALAVRLWQLPMGQRAMAEGGQGAWKLFTTTLCNPKGLVIGLVLLPSQQSLATALAAFLVILLVVSAVWAGIGSAVAASGVAERPGVRRIFACWLGTLSVWLASVAFSG